MNTFDPLDLEEDGRIEVSYGGVTLAVDLYQANNHIVDVWKSQPDAVARHNAVAEYLEGLGFPRPSHRVADRFAGAIFARVQDLGKADAGESNPD